MKVLLIGSGGREAALAWAIRNSPKLTALYCAPGSADMARHGENVAIDAADVDALTGHAVAGGYDLVVVGPEAPLVAGLADRLTDAGIPVFGPQAAAAEIEGSKVFAKEFMRRHDIPTGGYRVFDDATQATGWLRSPEAVYPLVLKADGLAAGKGVFLVNQADEAVRIAGELLEGKLFGGAGARLLVEEMLHGREVSFFVLTDGERLVELATCQDYKRARDDDRGGNTGGMGTYSPSVYLSDEMRLTLLERVARPAVRGMAEEGRPYRGVLYCGVMLTEAGPKVLEFNARFGDPEAQVLLPRLDGDWLPVLLDCARGELSDQPLRWKPEAAVCVVMASDGYPGSYAKGHAIAGLEAAEALDGVLVFHAGTTRDDSGRFVTRGGRVLGVTALGPDLAAARRRAYEAVDCISWDGAQHRRDIARDALERIAARDSR